MHHTDNQDPQIWVSLARGEEEKHEEGVGPVSTMATTVWN